MSIVNKLVNKIKYRIDQFVTDPDAEAAAARAKRAEHLTQMKETDASAPSGSKTVTEISGAKLDVSGVPQPEPTAMEEITRIFVKVFTYTIGIFLAMLFGSMSANVAIHRSPPVRILYFIYGILAGIAGLIFIINPFTVIPTVMLLILCKYYDYLPHWYAFLPLTTTPSEGNILRLLKKPFYWDPSNPDDVFFYKEKLEIFKKNLESGLSA